MTFSTDRPPARLPSGPSRAVRPESHTVPPTANYRALDDNLFWNVAPLTPAEILRLYLAPIYRMEVTGRHWICNKLNPQIKAQLWNIQEKTKKKMKHWRWFRLRWDLCEWRLHYKNRQDYISNWSGQANWNRTTSSASRRRFIVK